MYKKSKCLITFLTADSEKTVITRKKFASVSTALKYFRKYNSTAKILGARLI